MHSNSLSPARISSTQLPSRLIRLQPLFRRLLVVLRARRYTFRISVNPVNPGPHPCNMEALTHPLSLSCQLQMFWKSRIVPHSLPRVNSAQYLEYSLRTEANNFLLKADIQVQRPLRPPRPAPYNNRRYSFFH